MLSDYVFVGLLIGASALLPIVALGMARMARPRQPNHLKSAPYECGVETIGATWVQFRVQYYIYALVFVVFDVEAALLLPWAVVYRALSLYTLFEVALFLLILIAGLVWAWRNDALRWS